MMGMQTKPAQLFYDFCLDATSPKITCFDASTISRSREGAHGAEAILKQHRPPLD
jgi:hypothetical protein